jgi:hypothetical protein
VRVLVVILGILICIVIATFVAKCLDYAGVDPKKVLTVLKCGLVALALVVGLSGSLPPSTGPPASPVPSGHPPASMLTQSACSKQSWKRIPRSGVFSRGELTVELTCATESVDLDVGPPAAGGSASVTDVRFTAATPGQPARMSSGRQAVASGMVRPPGVRQGVSESECAASVAIPRLGAVSRDVPLEFDAQFCVKTNQGRIARIRIIRLEGAMIGLSVTVFAIA